MSGYKPRRSRKSTTSEQERRRTTHRSLKDRVRAGHPGAVEELRAFRAAWADRFRRRMNEAASLEEEEHWATLCNRWTKLAQREGI